MIERSQIPFNPSTMDEFDTHLREEGTIETLVVERHGRRSIRTVTGASMVDAARKEIETGRFRIRSSSSDIRYDPAPDVTRVLMRKRAGEVICSFGTRLSEGAQAVIRERDLEIRSNP